MSPANDKPKDKNTKRQPNRSVASNSITLDAENPLPIEFNSNIFVSLKGKKYVPFLNPLDHFGQLLTEAKLLSATTLSCVTSKAQYCAGKGLYLVKGDKDTMFTDWIKTVNRKQDSMYDVIHKVFNELFTVGNAYVRVVRGKIGGKKFVRVYNIPYLDCRLSYPDMDDICNTVYISKYFRKQGLWNIIMMKTEEIPIWTPNMFDMPWALDDAGNEHTIFHLKNDMAGYDYYGMPANIGTLPQQLLEYKSARYNLDQFENNLIIGGLIVVKGAMTEEERKKLAKNVVFTHTGDGKQGRWIVVGSEAGMGDGIDVKPFNTEKEGSFIESDTHNSEKIYIGNKWNKLLIGGSENKNLGSGNSSYIRGVFDIANETVILPEQERLMTKFIGPLMQICDEWMGTKWSKYEMAIKTMQPVSFLGDIDVNAIITKNEGRDLIGKPPMEGDKGDEFIKTAPGKGDGVNNGNDVQNQ